MPIQAEDILQRFIGQDDVSPVVEQIRQAEAALIQETNQASAALQQSGAASTQAAQAHNELGGAIEQVHGLTESFQGGVSGLVANLGAGGLVGAAGAAGAALGLLATEINKAIEAAAAEETNIARFNIALHNNAGEWEGQAEAIERVIVAGERKGFSDDAQRTTLARLLDMTGDYGRSLQILDAAQDFSAATGLKLEEAGVRIARAMEGQTRGLRLYLPALKDGADAQEVLTAVTQKWNGAAEEMATTTEVAAARAGNAWQNLQETIGGAGNPSAGAGFDRMAELGNSLNNIVLQLTEAEDGANTLGQALAGVPTVRMLSDLVQDLTDIGRVAPEATKGTLDEAAAVDILARNTRNLAGAMKEVQDARPAPGFTTGLIRGGFEGGADTRDEAADRDEAQRKLDVFLQQREAAAGVERATENLRNVTAGYADTVSDLTDRQRALQNALRDDSTPDLAAARRDLDQATQSLAQTTADYEQRLSTLNAELRQATGDAKAAIDPLQTAFDDARDALERFTFQSGEELHKLELDLRGAKQALDDVKTSGDQFLAGAIQAVKDAEASLEALRQAARNARNEFDQTQRGITVDRTALEDRERAALTPLREEIDGYKRILEEAARDTEQILAPLDDAIYDQARAYQAAQDAVRQLSAAYAERLLPLQRELNELRREEAAITAAERLQQQQVGIENLQARLANAQAGSAEFLQISQQLAQAQNRASREGRAAQLTGQIGEIEAERDIKLEPLQRKAELEREELDRMRQRRAEIEREADLNTRATREALANAERRMSGLQRDFGQERAIIESRQRELDRERATFEYNQRQREIAAENQLRWDRQTLASQQALVNALVAQEQAKVTAIGKTIEQKRFEDQETARLLSNEVRTTGQTLAQVRAHWDTVTGAIRAKIEETRLDQTTAVTAAQTILTDARTKYAELRGQYDLNIRKIGEQIPAVKSAATEAEGSAQRQVVAAQSIQKALQDAVGWYNALKNAAAGGATLPGQQVTSPVTGTQRDQHERGSNSTIPQSTQPYGPPRPPAQPVPQSVTNHNTSVGAISLAIQNALRLGPEAQQPQFWLPYVNPIRAAIAQVTGGTQGTYGPR